MAVYDLRRSVRGLGSRGSEGEGGVEEEGND